MSFQLQDVILAARDRCPAFSKARMPDAVFARRMTDYQNELLRKCVGRQPHFLDQSVVITLALTQPDPGVVGAGTAGGLPATAPTPTTFGPLEQTAGPLVDSYTDPAKGGTVTMVDSVVASATATTVTVTGAGRTVNGDVGAVVEITVGTGIGQRRVVQSNTATQWTFAVAWAQIPDTTSMIRVVTPLVVVARDAAVVTALPALGSQTGYLVRISAAGVPFIDYTAPLVASVDVGVQLPSISSVAGGTVRYIDGETDPLVFTTYGSRFSPSGFPAVWQDGEKINLCGSTFDWVEVASLEIRYSPITPAFQFLTDVFLFPDSARPAFVGQAAAYAATRLAGQEGVPVNVDGLVGEGAAAEANYLSSLTLSKRARTTVIRQGFW